MMTCCNVSKEYGQRNPKPIEKEIFKSMYRLI